ncbi:hypothetical protein IWQ62_003584 [Dispira parvispora]|uniref:Condensin complex subunit 2 n=1 Tax=Dispira parvispora TaxID=1520584 RepID=A0A9W8E6X6_9FUNG|nr:hypothetical protein IWQ62_003584 [Dispira parvispora]
MATTFQGAFQTPRRSNYVETEVPLKDTSNWNDDQTERRVRRRRSFLSPQSAAKSFQTPGRKSLAQPLQVVGAGGLLSPHNSASILARLTPEELNRRYEEWMKIAADNKINATNTWDVALIDYFYDMSLLRDGDSINFQKASCTLDGCVKIYSSRVDSVATETGRLLNGLAESNRGDRRRSRGEDADDEDDADGLEADDDTNGQSGAKARRRATRSDNTLAKDFASISSKKFDLEFTVDPLFKKTSADFDEGGARGLLLNHLTVDSDGKIIFDAGDAAVALTPAGGDSSEPQDKPTVPSAQIDYGLLKSHFFNDLARTAELDICPSLKNFEFSKDNSLDITLLKQSLLDGEQDPSGDFPDDDHSHPLADDGPLFGHDGMDEDLGDVNGEVGLMMGDGSVDEDGSVLGGPGDETAGYPSLDGAAGQPHMGLSITQDEDDIFSYFDRKLIKGWAGPNHWKLHPALQIKPGQPDKANVENGKAENKRVRIEKQPFFVDFSQESNPREEEDLFAPPARQTSLLLTGSFQRTGYKQNRHLLPDDIHFSSKNLTALFLKPRCRIKSWKPDNQGDLAFSMAQGTLHPTSQSQGVDDAVGAGLPVADTEEGPFSHATDAHASDNDDDLGIGAMDDDAFALDLDDGDGPELSTALVDSPLDTLTDNLTMPELRVIKPLYVNYARTAKRVDVKRLKDNLWKKLVDTSEGPKGSVESTPAKDKADPTDDTMTTEDSEPNSSDLSAVQGEQRFSNVMGGLKTVYPEKSIQDISVSFCFICLLHLANEKNLKITQDGSLEDLIITQDASSPTPSY